MPDFVHVLSGGRIVKSGGKELALELEQKGYGWIEAASRTTVDVHGRWQMQMRATVAVSETDAVRLAFSGSSWKLEAESWQLRRE